MKGKKVGVISLGCDKNRVDTEKMLGEIVKNHTLVSDVEDAEIVIINTCAFLESSRIEAINEILSVSENKNKKLEKLIVTGCFPQKFIDEIFDELIEADAFLGVSDYEKINQVIDELYESDKRLNFVTPPKTDILKKRVLTTENYAYLKIADGCNNHCTYCLIPYIRGKYRSAFFDDLIEEAKSLGKVNELILVAQDTTKYGEDLDEGKNLVLLIRALSLLENIKGIRLLYCYPENITDQLINEFNINSKLIRYIDIPLQHADDKVLKLMGRKGSFNEYLSLIEKLKNSVKGIAIRSTFITGFSGESEEAFNRLIEFIQKAKLFNAGFFKFSCEKGTPAEKLPDKIDEKTKDKRLKKLYSVQKAVVKENLKSLIGKVFSVYPEGFDEEQLVYYGRAYFNAPDIDGKIFFFCDEEVDYSKSLYVKILKVSGYDLYGEKI